MTDSIPLPTLRVGQTCDVTIDAAQDGGQYKSRIEDVDGPKLQIAMPTRRGEPVIPPMGQQIQIVTQTSSGSSVFIQAEVTGRQSQPFPVLTVRVLSASQQQARSYFRAAVNVWPAECSVWRSPPDEGDAGVASPAADTGGRHAFWQPLRATVHDLSGGGAALVAHEHVHEGERVKLRFPLPHGGGEFAAAGAVRRSAALSPDQKGQPRWEIGIAFDALAADQRDRLVKAVTRVQAEERRRQTG